MRGADLDDRVACQGVREPRELPVPPILPNEADHRIKWHDQGVRRRLVLRVASEVLHGDSWRLRANMQGWESATQYVVAVSVDIMPYLKLHQKL